MVQHSAGQFMWKGAWGECLFEGGRFHWPSGRLEAHITQLHGSRALILPDPQDGMVDTHLTTKAAAGGSAPTAPTVADACTQMELLKEEAAVQTSDCRKGLDLSPGADTGGRPACKICAQVANLLLQVAELQKVVRRLCNIRETEKQLDSWFQVQSAVDPQPMTRQSKALPSAHTEGRRASAEDWEFDTAKTIRRKRLLLKADVPLQNCFTTLQTEKERLVTSGEMLELSKAAQSVPFITTRANKKR